jgi:hypothetical protein
MIASAGRMIATMLLLPQALPEGYRITSVDWTERIEGDTLYIDAKVSTARELNKVRISLGRID